MWTIILLIILVTPTFSQQSDTTGLGLYFKYIISNNFEFEYQNWERDKHSFPPGTYYQFEGIIEYKNGKKSITHKTNINQLEMLIGFLLGKGIPIKEIWYKQSESNCHGEQTEIPSSLLIRTENEIPEKRMNAFGFERTKPIIPSACPYNIRHYVFR